jgi:hypothetical protein
MRVKLALYLRPFMCHQLHLRHHNDPWLMCHYIKPTAYNLSDTVDSEEF